MKKTPLTSIPTARLADNWTATKADLSAAAVELAEADCAVVEAHTALMNAQASQKAAIERKTSAEKRLHTLRSKLSVQIG